MWQKDDLFTTSMPDGPGRVVGKQDKTRIAQYGPVGHGVEKSIPAETVRQLLVNAVLKECDIPELDNSLKNMPFKTAQKIAALRILETYLMAQLVQVRKEITKVTQESVAENEVKDGRVRRKESSN